MQHYVKQCPIQTSFNKTIQNGSIFALNDFLLLCKMNYKILFVWIIYFDKSSETILYAYLMKTLCKCVDLTCASIVPVSRMQPIGVGHNSELPKSRSLLFKTWILWIGGRLLWLILPTSIWKMQGDFVY